MTGTDIRRDSTLSIVGIGYGGDVTARAADLLGRADLVVGHPDFIGQVAHLLKPDTEATDVVADAEPGQDVFALRARLAAEALASGRRAVIVTAGDPGPSRDGGAHPVGIAGAEACQDVEIVPACRRGSTRRRSSGPRSTVASSRPLSVSTVSPMPTSRAGYGARPTADWERASTCCDIMVRPTPSSSRRTSPRWT